jgi:hypothetical protein
VTRAGKLGAGFVLVLAALFACTRGAPPAPIGVPDRASENPEDVRARMPFRPTPPQPETKFPPPQQSVEEEALRANKPDEPELLHVQPAILLDGAPFPQKTTHEPNFPEARRLRYVSPDAVTDGDGSLERPWKDLDQALCRLVPGDRLVLAAAVYEGSFHVGPSCRAGTADLPIQVFARHAFLKPRGDADVLTVEQPHWQFWELQIALLQSRAAGFVTKGPDAHDIALDQSHVYEGKGPAVRLATESSRITISNSHIHQATGVEIEAGTREITIIASHIHHNLGAAVVIGIPSSPGDLPAESIHILGNRFQNDHGGALRLLRCRGVQILRNTIANYRPDEESGFAGDAVAVESGSGEILIEGNSLLEASIGVRVGAPDSGGAAPEKVVIQRNFFQNLLTSQSVAFVVDSGRDVRFYNNVVDRYAEGFRAGAAGLRDLSVANNLFVGVKTAFVLPAPGAVSFLDYNVFAPDRDLHAVIGGSSQRLAAYAAGRMPHTRILSGVEISGGDLGKVVGFSPVDQGAALPGIPYRGAAPDIGIAER